MQYASYAGYSGRGYTFEDRGCKENETFKGNRHEEQGQDGGWPLLQDRSLLLVYRRPCNFLLVY